MPSLLRCCSGASALMGALQFGMGAVASIALSALSDGTAVPLAVAVNLLGRRRKPRDGDPLPVRRTCEQSVNDFFPSAR